MVAHVKEVYAQAAKQAATPVIGSVKPVRQSPAAGNAADGNGGDPDPDSSSSEEESDSDSDSDRGHRHETHDGDNSDGEEEIEHIELPPLAAANGSVAANKKSKSKKKAETKTKDGPKKVKTVRALDQRGKKLTLRAKDPYKPPIAKDGTWVGEDGKVYGPYIEGMNESYIRENPRDCYDWYEPGPRERLSQRRLPSADKIYAMEGVTQPWKQAYVAHRYN